MIAHSPLLQGPAQAPTPPPIPALPGRPGAATGGGSNAPAALPGPAQAARDAATAAQDAATAAQDAATVAQDIATAARDGQGFTPGAQTTGSGIPFDPEALIRQTIPIVGMTLSMVVVIFIGWPLARAFARRLDRRTELGTVRAADLQPQIRQLQESIDTIAIELERISESQRFQAKLMAERPQALPSEQKRS